MVVARIEGDGPREGAVSFGGSTTVRGLFANEELQIEIALAAVAATDAVRPAGEHRVAA